jgi:hypothetical protein
MEQAAATAPWVEFRKISTEDRNASVETGTYVARDVDYAFITPAGSKDCVEKPVKEWFESLQQQVDSGRFPAEWLRAFRGMYEAWQKNEEIPVDGTSVKNWAVASPAQIEMLLKLHVRTVEQLAAANEEVISRLGMGARNLVDKAKAYVTQQSGGVGKMAEENAGLKRDLEVAKTSMSTLEETVRMLQAQVAALSAAAGSGQSEAPPAAPSMTISDLLDPPQSMPAPAARKL